MSIRSPDRSTLILPPDRLGRAGRLRCVARLSSPFQFTFEDQMKTKNKAEVRRQPAAPNAAKDEHRRKQPPNFYAITPQKYWPLPADLLANSRRGIWSIIRDDNGKHDGYLITEERGRLEHPVGRSPVPGRAIATPPCPNWDLGNQWAWGLAQRAAMRDEFIEKYADDLLDMRGREGAIWSEWLGEHTFIDLPFIGRFVLPSNTVVCAIELSAFGGDCNHDGVKAAMARIQEHWLTIHGTRKRIGRGKGGAA
jgi:hypothetical protein